MAAKHNSVKKDVITSTLQSLTADLKNGGYIIRGSLSIDAGHDYWWFLEYGTGQFHGQKGDPDGELDQPSETEGYSPEGGPYEIRANDADYLVYMTMRNGRYIKRVDTIHPGVHPIGMVRSSLFSAMIYLKKDLAQLKKGRKWKELPRRADFVKIVNYILEVLIGQLRLLTPDYSDPDPRHDGRHATTLSSAWNINKAK
jgi:hypothetical protein